MRSASTRNYLGRMSPSSSVFRVSLRILVCPSKTSSQKLKSSKHRGVNFSRERKNVMSSEEAKRQENNEIIEHVIAVRAIIEGKCKRCGGVCQAAWGVSLIHLTVA